MRLTFKSRRPKHRAEAAPVKYGYKFCKPAPELCMPCVDLYGYEAVEAEAADIRTAYYWGMDPIQWHSLTDFERANCRRNVTAAPRYQS